MYQSVRCGQGFGGFSRPNLWWGTGFCFFSDLGNCRIMSVCRHKYTWSVFMQPCSRVPLLLKHQAVLGPHTPRRVVNGWPAKNDLPRDSLESLDTAVIVDTTKTPVFDLAKDFHGIRRMHKPLMPPTHLPAKIATAFLSNGVSTHDKHLPTRADAATAS